MSHALRSHYFHIVWSTKGRRNWITSEIQTGLHRYIGGIVHNNKNHLMNFGGTGNHVHLLVAMNSIDKYSALIRDMKAKSCVWVRNNHPSLSFFAWQEGYGSFSVSSSRLEKITQYITNQEKHHKVFTFEEEFKELLHKHKVQYDNRFFLG
jgi:REP element-mobilizing transposase RayT